MINPAHARIRNGSRTGSAYGTVAVLALLGAAVVFLGVKVVHLNGQVGDVQKQLAQSVASNAQVQSDLSGAKAAASQLQAQLDKAGTKQADLQGQLDQAKDSLTRLQALADEETAHGNDLQSQLDKAKAQTADLQTQINDNAAGSTAMLDEAKGQIVKSQGSIDRLQSWFLKGRHLPVTTVFEKVEGGRSFTLHLTNLYVQPLNVRVAITGAMNTRSQANPIDGGATLDIATLTAGENVVISSDGYDPVTLSVQ